MSETPPEIAPQLAEFMLDWKRKNNGVYMLLQMIMSVDTIDIMLEGIYLAGVVDGIAFERTNRANRKEPAG